MTRPKLLLADDSVTIREVIEQTFAAEGMDVTTAATGEEAMRKFVEVQPDIVILDVNMPDPTGYSLCEMIKKDKRTTHIPVLLIVGSFEPFDQDEAERVGADGFLTKPFQSIRDLIIRVEELLGTEHRAAVMVETTDIDSLLDSSFSEPAVLSEKGSAEILLGDAGMDDEIIEMSHPGLRATPGNGGSGRGIIGEDDVLTLNNTNNQARAVSLREDPQTQQEPSEEFIALVARRVVDKLSDKVVREIAMEAVPRIAEDLIREALEDEKKS